MIRNVCLAAAFALCLAAPSSASAYWPYGGYGGFYGGNGWGWGFNHPTDYVPAPPYFALYPPVYYSSQITARHYGASPFAWSPGMHPITYVPQAEPVAQPQPEMIQNPYVRGARASNSKGTTNQAAMIMNVEPEKISNPFVASLGR